MTKVVRLTKASKALCEIQDLPFVGKRIGPDKNQISGDFWHKVVSTGDWAKDQDLGSQYAYLALRSIKFNDFAPLLGWIVIDMIRHKCPEHIALGFFQTVSDVCLGYYKIPTGPLFTPLPRRERGKAVQS
jgi:hypothetical protein